MDREYIPVKVALRCRPLVSKEIDAGCNHCLQFIPNQPQVLISSKPFTYDYVFSTTSTQNEVFETTVEPLLAKALEGYNITILAYGQTGSGKTYTMGTNCFSISEEDIENNENVGIIPKTINEIFKYITNYSLNDEDENPSKTDFKTSVSFIEIYKENIIDLLTDKMNKDKESIVIREDPIHGIKVAGIKEMPVKNLAQTLAYLEMGSAVRSTASTAMNLTSSRSHAIFSISIEKLVDDTMVSQSKLHFVDLAGSERVKKTMAEGERFREGVNINKGLLALGNMITALSEDAKRKCENSFVQYRDSKLTHILKDSLGGNSHTIMIACVSPADSNMEETINTLRYADRTRKIKNRPIINIDPLQEELINLRNKVRQQEAELLQYRSEKGIFAEADIISQKTDEIAQYKSKLEKVALEFRKYLEENIVKETENELLKKEVEFYKQKYRMRQNATQMDESGQAIDNTQDEKDFTKELEILEKEKEEFLNDFKTVHDQQDEDECGSPLKDKIEQLLNQADLNMELKGVTQAITNKEQLIKKMLMNEDEINGIKQKYEEEVQALQHEKETLTLALQEAKNKNFKELSDKRRRRLMELEGELMVMRKKISDHEKLIKIREENQQLIGKLRVDILDLKQARVRLIRQMKDEGEKYRKINLEKEKEVIRLKTNTRKREVAYTQKEQQFKAQQAVLRRKNEEILSANKRLKDALAKRQAVAAMRSQHSKSHQSNSNSILSTMLVPKDKGNKGNNPSSTAVQTIADSLNQVIEKTKDECNLRVWHRIAKKHIEQLINERKDLVEQVKELEEELADEPCAKKRSLSESLGESKTEGVRAQVEALQKEINLKSQQLSTVQSQVFEVDQCWENNASFNSPWEGLEVHLESSLKLYHEWFFNAYIDAKVESTTELNMRSDMVEMHRSSTQQLMRELDEAKTVSRQLEEQNDKLRRESEEKIQLILKQTGSLLKVETTNSDQGQFLTQLQEKDMMIEQLKNTIEAYNTQLSEREDEILAYEEEFKKVMPNRLLTPGGVKTRQIKGRRTQNFKELTSKFFKKADLSPESHANPDCEKEEDAKQPSPSFSSMVDPNLLDQTYQLTSANPSDESNKENNSEQLKQILKRKGLRSKKINKYTSNAFFSPYKL